MRKITKLFVTKAQSIDEKSMTAKFKISDNQPDRMGEIVDQSWDFKDYEANPILLWGHNPEQPENVLGTTLSLEVDKENGCTYATVKFDKDINPKAELVFNQVARGTLRTVSVGFIPHDEAKENDVTVLKNNELLEISVVPIPANPRAIALSYRELGISHKDAEFMVKSMQAEAELLQKELSNDTKDVSMDELTKAIQDLAAAVAAQGEVLARIDTNVAKMVDEEAAEDEDEQDGGSDEGDENPDGTPAKAGKPKATKDAGKDDTANGGSDDTSGADDGDAGDEVDEDTELTPEQQKEFDAELAKALEAENVEVK